MKYIIRNMTVLFVLLAGGVLSQPSIAERGYEGYASSNLDEAPWYNAVKSAIDYSDTPVGAIRTVAWCGIDNSGDGGWKWIQGGWQKNHEGEAEIYWEYTDENGEWHLGTDTAPSASETYEQVKDGDNVKWKHGDTVYKEADWDLFDTIEFKRSYIGAEMHQTPADHTPGVEEAKNRFAASQVRRMGGDYADADLNSEINSAQQGNVETYGNAGSNLRTWDDRSE